MTGELGSAAQAATALAVGFVSGVLSGAFGIGGGLVTTPALRLLLGTSALVAVGTPLPVIVPSAVTGALSFHRRGFGDAPAGVVLGLAGSLTSVLGALLSVRLGGRIVLIGTAVIIACVAADLVVQALRPPASAPTSGGGPTPAEAPAPARPRWRGHLPMLLALGAVTGLYSGLFGLGGGFVLVPLLVRAYRLPIKDAIATSLVAVALLAAPGSITHAVLGNVDWRMAAALVLGVVPGALLGSRLTMRAADARVRLAFATLLVVVAVLLAGGELGWIGS